MRSRCSGSGVGENMKTRAEGAVYSRRTCDSANPGLLGAAAGAAPAHGSGSADNAVQTQSEAGFSENGNAGEENG